MRSASNIVALAGLIGASGCVSLLGVDKDDYEDIDETICSCISSGDANGGDALKGACEEIVQGLLEGERALETATTCVAESATCAALDECLAGDVCIAMDGSCSLEDGFQVRCCDGGQCLGGSCAPPCEAPRVVCIGVCCPDGNTCENGACTVACTLNGSTDECGNGQPECCDGACVGGRCIARL